MDASRVTGDTRLNVGRDSHGNVLVAGDIHITVVDSRNVLTPAAAPSPTKPGRNPYKGLEAFHEEDSQFFYGREDLVEDLLDRFHALYRSSPRILFIHGATGSGKSSVVRAGLVPRLAERPIAQYRSAQVAVFTPGMRPLESLAGVLAQIATGDRTPVAKAREFTEELRTPNAECEFDGLRRIAAVIGASRQTALVLLIDQFEEVYSQCRDETARSIFIDNVLCAAGDPSRQLSAVATVRSDFLGQLDRSSEELGRVVARTGVFVPKMTRDELTRAISLPAERAGRPLDSALVDLLLRQARGSEGVLPLLQFALTQIWLGMEAGTAPLDTLRRVGGVGGALATVARAIYDGLDGDDERALTRQVFLRMVHVGEDVPVTRRKVRVADLVPHGRGMDTVRAILERFAQPNSRVVTLSGQPDGSVTAEITHEALLEHWSDLRGWIEQNTSALLFQEKLDEAAREWKAHGEHRGLLWSSLRLKQLRDFHRLRSGDMTTLQLAFYRASDRNSRLRTTVIVAAAALVLGAGGSWAASLLNGGSDGDGEKGKTAAVDRSEVVRGEDTAGSPPAVESEDSAQDSVSPAGGAPEDMLATALQARWPTGGRVRIRFLDGDTALHRRVAEVASQWTRHANLRFEFVSSGDSDVRVSFNVEDSWSYLGNQAQRVDPSQPTMMLGLARAAPDSTYFAHVVLHEFGHVLGLVEERMNPGADIPWDSSALEGHGLALYHHKYATGAYRPFDPTSVMMRPVSNELTRGDYEIGVNWRLSESDKALARRLYPPTSRKP